MTLIAFSGFPGSGKSTLSKMLSKHLNAFYIRIDSIEQAIRDSQFNDNDVKDEGYLVGFSIALDNLQNDQIVVADSVNPMEITRRGWSEVAQETNVKLIDIEVQCSDKVEHKKRIENRKPDIKNHVYPSWEETISREYDSSRKNCIIIDTAGKSVSESWDELIIKINDQL